MNEIFNLILKQAKQAALNNEVPVGAAIIDNEKKIIALTSNKVEEYNDPTAHAEILAIKQACKALKNTKLNNCDLYVTIEPCPMCASAISLSRIRRLYFGAYDPKTGGVDHGAKIFAHQNTHHKPEYYGGFYEAECAQLMKDFFKEKREK